MPSGGMALSIVIPAYNEATRLPPTLVAARRFLEADGRRAEIIVVDDGSRDDTSVRVREAGAEDARIRLVRLPQNRGKGYAVRTGVMNAVGARVLFADADGSTPFAELYRLDAAIDAGADVAIGSRALRGKGTRVDTPLYRRLAGRTFHALVRSLTVRGIKDTQCGFKLFRHEAAMALFSRMRMNGFSFDVELLLMARHMGYEVAEIPVNWTHVEGSKTNLARDGLLMTRDLFRIRARLLRGGYREAGVHIPTPAAVPVVDEHA
jgi:dolichyl-phosphate beta-glucosyltransferase